MACGIKVIAAFLACVTVASAVIAPFPHGKTTVYKFRTVVKSTNTEESLYASQFVLQGTLDITHDGWNQNLANAYTFVLSNLTTDMHNGQNVDYDEKPIFQSIDDVATVIHLPLQIIYKNDGTFQTINLDKREPTWSRNMKKAMVALLQIDLPRIKINELANKPLTFIAEEKKIHGICSVTYNVYPMDQINENTSQKILVNKKFSPIDCTNFSFDEFNNVDIDDSKTKKTEHMSTESIEDIEIEKQDEGILIKKLVAQSFLKVLPANGAQNFFVITNTTLELVQVKEKSPSPIFVKALTQDDGLTYWNPLKYMDNGAYDVTLGRHVVNLSSLQDELEKLLSEAFAYIENNHLSQNDINWSHARTINKILRTMSYMDAGALEKTFDIFGDSISQRSKQIRNIFSGIVAQVGTPAACNFTLKLILENKISAKTAVDMLGRLPLSVKVPTEKLLIQMEELRQLNDSIPAEVRKAGILSFSSLIYKTFKNSVQPQNNPILQKYLKDFFEHVKDEQTYEMKVIYLMAMKNIQVGRIHDLLEPMIRGHQLPKEDPDRFRLLTIWAMNKPAQENYDAVSKILQYVMKNKSLSTKLRIAAYEILMNQAPDEKSALYVHDWVMNFENSNKHFLNYHYTTLESIAKSANQCKKNLRTIVKSILKDIDYSRHNFPRVQHPLSSVQSISYIDDTFINSEKFDLRMIVNELTGVPEVLQIEQETVDNYGTVSDISIQVHIEGHEDLPTVLRPNFEKSVKPTEIIEVLEKASKSVPTRKELKIDVVLMRNGRVIWTNHYDFDNLVQIHDDLMHYYHLMTGTDSIDHQFVVFDRLYEKRLISDFGLPVIVETRVPIVTSMMINHTNIFRWPLSLSLDLKFKRWEHQDHSLSVYNPIKDVWHAVRDVTIHEVTVPFRVNMTEGKFVGSLKFSFPERVESEPSEVGFVILGKNLVTVDEDGTQALFESCNFCRNEEDVHDDHHGEYRESYLGIGYFERCVKSYLYPDDDAYPSKSFHDHATTWDGTFTSNFSHSWTGAIAQRMMDVRRWWKNVVLTGYDNHCTGVFKIEPNTKDPISEIDITIRGKYEDHDKNENTMELEHAATHRFTAAFDMISSRTNTSAALWNLDINVDKNRGHMKNKYSVKLVRKIPEEKNLKICIDVSKHYPAQPADYLMLRGTNQDIDSETIVAYGHAYDEECHRNETLMTFNLKAQLLDEQKKALESDLKIGSCNSEMKNALFANPMKSIPSTIHCLNEVIRYTTPRKYTFNVTHKLLPNTPIEHFMYAIPDDVDYGPRANFKLLAEFPIGTNSLEMKIVANSTIVATSDVRFENLFYEGQGPIMRPDWDFPLDNSRFDLKFLRDYNNDKIRFCLVYPQIIQREDGENSLFPIPSDEWILISGDHFDKQFAIFGRQTTPNYLSFFIFIRDYKVHFFTRQSDNVLVAVADDVEPEMEGGFRLPKDEGWGWRLKVTKSNDHFVVRTKDLPLTLRVGSNYISVAFGSELQGHISGLCGHLNGDKFSDESDVFSAKDIENIEMENANED